MTPNTLSWRTMLQSVLDGGPTLSYTTTNSVHTVTVGFQDGMHTAFSYNGVTAGASFNYSSSTSTASANRCA